MARVINLIGSMELTGMGSWSGAGISPLQRDRTEREVLGNEEDCTRGYREEGGEDGESVEDHVGQ